MSTARLSLEQMNKTVNQTPPAWLDPQGALAPARTLILEPQMAWLQVLPLPYALQPAATVGHQVPVHATRCLLWLLLQQKSVHAVKWSTSLRHLVMQHVATRVRIWTSVNLSASVVTLPNGMSAVVHAEQLDRRNSGPSEQEINARGTMEDATPDVEPAEQAAEKTTESAAPAIPEDIPNQVLLPRLGDRSAVMAPADAIGGSLILLPERMTRVCMYIWSQSFPLQAALQAARQPLPFFLLCTDKKDDYVHTSVKTT